MTAPRTLREPGAQTICLLTSGETDPGRCGSREALQAKMLTKDEARRIAINVARLPELPGRGS